jgi:hypothetical protein
MMSSQASIMLITSIAFAGNGNRSAVRRRARARHCVEPKQFHDIAGYYNRFDVFELKVRRERLQPIAFSDAGLVGGGKVAAGSHATSQDKPMTEESPASMEVLRSLVSRT